MDFIQEFIQYKEESTMNLSSQGGTHPKVYRKKFGNKYSRLYFCYYKPQSGSSNTSVVFRKSQLQIECDQFPQKIAGSEKCFVSSGFRHAPSPCLQKLVIKTTTKCGGFPFLGYTPLSEVSGSATVTFVLTFWHRWGCFERTQILFLLFK